MSLYAVKNDEGKWLCIEANGSHYWSRDDGDFFDQHDADTLAHVYGGQVVPLIEAPAKVVVSEEEAEMLKRAKTSGYPVSAISGWCDEGEEDHTAEDRFMRAYVNGWTVEKPKRYVLPMPYGADDDDPDQSHYAVVNREYHAGPAWHQGPCVSFKKAREHYTVTQADIDAAPDWVKAITPVEVTDDEQ
ncbi:DUF1642 domain-containing protein [Lacticaseibacillus suilingensis]|uniref:DUF1642 domain-containing protein n=1 Tax=Lacticaseibacillus suilingensis TaxID=2799577 RepID=A0ABW4BDQ3_9LACO|nr:DUF1642 domain-containing protein [Lacticaseibacillus suilingensis]